MSDQPPPQKKRSLTEISHLFLSSIRDRQMDGAQRPQRTPPVSSDTSIDLTPEEFARVYGGDPPAPAPERKPVPISAIIGAHLNGKQFDRVKEYARHLADRVGRIGLIELDASELRLMCFEPAEQAGPGDSDPQSAECVEPRLMIESLEELNWDVEHWLLLLPNPRTPEAKALLREIDHWVLLSTCDHDGVVSSYRMLKGLLDNQRPLLTLSLLDATDEGEVTRVFQKLSSVCQQFLDWPLDFESAVRACPQVCEHLVLYYRPNRDKAQMATASQWTVVTDFIAAGRVAQDSAVRAQLAIAAEAEIAAAAKPALVAEQAPITDEQETVQEMAMETAVSQQGLLVADVVVPEPPQGDRSEVYSSAKPQVAAGSQSRAMALAPRDVFDDVIDLPGGDASGQAILAALLRKASGDLIECPLRPPMCLEARLAVSRDRAVVLLAVANQGLHELQFIGQAYRWLKENRELIGMALPQFAIDPKQTPGLRLLVDRADLTADVLQPMLQSDHITVQAYRKLRWGEKRGVFLEAA
jgi:hypothetical protein